MNDEFENVNEIDMECNIDFDDDEGLNISCRSIPSNNDYYEDNGDDRGYQKETGIIIDLSDDDGLGKPMRTITAQAKPDGIDIDRNFKSNLNDFDDPNSIDMECNIGEDDDFDFPANSIDMNDDYFEHHINGDNYKSERDYDDYMDEIRFSNKELVDEDMIVEKKKISQGAVEANYWDKLQKKHAATNKKGAYNNHFHLSGNPEEEMKLFNHDMKPAPAPSVNAGDVAGNTNVSAGSASGNITGASAGGEGCCEKLNECFDDQINDVFLIIGFDILPNSNGTYTCLDTCNPDNDFECENDIELYTQLKPYIDDCIICPLEIETGNKFDTCSDWVDWYKDNADKYPGCAYDIKCCEALANKFEK